MSFGNVAIAGLATVDVQAPGAPGLSARQVSNSAGEFEVIAPTVDADGSPLTGVTFAQVVALQATADEAEQYRGNFEAAQALPGAQNFTIGLSAGQTVTGAFALVPDSNYAVLARAADHDNE